MVPNYPSVLCWAMSLPFGYEPELLAAQAQKHLSTFACDDFLVFSDATFPNTSSALKAVNIEVLEGPLTSPRGGDTNSYLNAPIFAKAWNQLFVDTRYKKFDWDVKVDADAVLFPDRLLPAWDYRSIRAPFPF